MTSEFYALSLGDPIGISALHGSGGVGDLLEVVTEDFEVFEAEEEDKRIRIAIVGRPNAGKSSISKSLVISSNKSPTPPEPCNADIAIGSPIAKE